jgi:hypothetical protein
MWLSLAYFSSLLPGERGVGLGREGAGVKGGAATDKVGTRDGGGVSVLTPYRRDRVDLGILVRADSVTGTSGGKCASSGFPNIE